MNKLEQAIELINTARDLIEQRARVDSLTRETLEGATETIGELLVALEACL